MLEMFDNLVVPCTSRYQIFDWLVYIVENLSFWLAPIQGVVQGM